MTSQMRDLVAILRTLHDRLAATTVELSPDQLRSRSYATEWTVADVLSHLGSGAELTLMQLDSHDEDGPSQEEMATVWATWDAREPEQQAVEGIATDERLVARLEELDDTDLQVLRRDLAGMDVDAAGMLRQRVSEHAMHSWDIAVAFDDAAVLPAEAVPDILALLPVTLRFATQQHDDDIVVDVTTTDPDRTLRLDLLPGGSRVIDAPGADDGANTAATSLELPAEALLRLIYGRLDAGHTPPVKAADESLLPRLREIFRGF
jgi:uncharacterized protein (TIGR03083 family)